MSMVLKRDQFSRVANFGEARGGMTNVGNREEWIIVTDVNPKRRRLERGFNAVRRGSTSMQSHRSKIWGVAFDQG